MALVNLIQNGDFSQTNLTPSFYEEYRYVNSDNIGILSWDFNAILLTSVFFQGTLPPIPPPQHVVGLQSTNNNKYKYTNISQVVNVTPGEGYTLTLYTKQRYELQGEVGFYGTLNILVDDISIGSFDIENWEEWRKIRIAPVFFTNPNPKITFEQPYSKVTIQGTNDVTTCITGISLTLGANEYPVYSPPFTLHDITLVSLPYTITSSNIHSNSSAPFTYTSSDPSIASVNENIITVNSVGSTEITASQEETLGFNSGSASTQLNVIASTPSEPTLIQTGPGLIYFMNSEAQYAQITNSKLLITPELIPSNFKYVVTEDPTNITKI